jgi:hypothetical protein
MHKRIIGSAIIMVLTVSQVLFSFPFNLPNAQEAHAAGTTYYVSSSSGNDSNAGTSQSSPWRSLSVEVWMQGLSVYTELLADTEF